MKFRVFWDILPCSQIDDDLNLTTRQYIPEDSELHVRVKFLPANTTPILQLMDQGIIRSFKQRCHKHLVCRYFQQITNTKETFSFFI
jgi:hypothetical protein